MDKPDTTAILISITPYSTQWMNEWRWGDGSENQSP